MIILQKDKSKSFTILNLTDFQLTEGEWQITHKNGAITHYTLDELYKRSNPDLVTISGDLAWCGDYAALECLASKLDTYNVPYTAVWGNHDQDKGIDKVEEALNRVFSHHPLFLYEQGPKELGNGNFVIQIKEDEGLICSLILMDSHDRVPYLHSDGKEYPVWAKLYDSQVEWYKKQVSSLKCQGCKNAILIMHIPIYAYHYAFDNALKEGLNHKEITLKQSYDGSCWKKGYEDSFGIKTEDVCSYPQDEHVFEAIKECGLTSMLLAGHDHVNCFSVSYEGVRFVYALKTGPGCYYKPELNGGTVIKIDSQGVCEHYHEFIDASHLI